MSFRRFVPKRLDLGTVATIVLVAILAWRAWPQLAAALGAPAGSRQAPDFTVETLDGTQLSRADLRGKVVLVNFWATWCPPCRVEMPGFQDVYDKRGPDGFVILGLSVDARGGAHVAQFLADRGITYPVAMARGSIGRDFGGSHMLPTSYLIDREGRIRHEVRGIFTELALDQAVSRLLDEPVPADPGGAH
jgi:peroxiredoxin